MPWVIKPQRSSRLWNCGTVELSCPLCPDMQGKASTRALFTVVPGHPCHSSLELQRECIPTAGSTTLTGKHWEREHSLTLSEIKPAGKKNNPHKKGCGGTVTWQLTTMSSSSSVLPELPSLVWFSLLVCEERSPFGAQLPRLPRNLDKFVSIRRFCRMLCGCWKKEHTQKSGGSQRKEKTHSAPSPPVVPMGQGCSHRRDALNPHSP